MKINIKKKQMKDIGLKRNNMEKYYTKPEIVDMCIKKLPFEIKSTDIVIEPSAGNGAFIESLKGLSENVFYYDIDPEHELVQKQDFLLLNPPIGKKIHVIGNPPFGRQSSLTLKFIKKSCSFAETVSFILPKSFKKNSFKNKIPKNFHMMLEIDLPENSFTVNGIDHNVPCIFQVWEKKTFNRCIPDKLVPRNFEFVSKKENPCVSIRRVGIYAGKASDVIQDKNIQTHYFLKFKKNHTYKYDIVKKLNEIEYLESLNTVGPKSISKQELIMKINEII